MLKLLTSTLKQHTYQDRRGLEVHMFKVKYYILCYYKHHYHDYLYYYTVHIQGLYQIISPTKHPLQN